jgi:hypothetical protein
LESTIIDLNGILFSLWNREAVSNYLALLNSAKKYDLKIWINGAE